jgi:hypothetical protein
MVTVQRVCGQRVKRLMLLLLLLLHRLGGHGRRASRLHVHHLGVDHGDQSPRVVVVVDLGVQNGHERGKLVLVQSSGCGRWHV